MAGLDAATVLKAAAEAGVLPAEPEGLSMQMNSGDDLLGVQSITPAQGQTIHMSDADLGLEPKPQVQVPQQQQQPAEPIQQQPPQVLVQPTAVPQQPGQPAQVVPQPGQPGQPIQAPAADPDLSGLTAQQLVELLGDDIPELKNLSDNAAQAAQTQQQLAAAQTQIAQMQQYMNQQQPQQQQQGAQMQPAGQPAVIPVNPLTEINALINEGDQDIALQKAVGIIGNMQQGFIQMNDQVGSLTEYVTRMDNERTVAAIKSEVTAACAAKNVPGLVDAIEAMAYQTGGRTPYDSLIDQVVSQFPNAAAPAPAPAPNQILQPGQPGQQINPQQPGVQLQQPALTKAQVQQELVKRGRTIASANVPPLQPQGAFPASQGNRQPVKLANMVNNQEVFVNQVTGLAETMLRDMQGDSLNQVGR